jgi:hypothetical protein
MMGRNDDDIKGQTQVPPVVIKELQACQMVLGQRRTNDPEKAIVEPHFDFDLADKSAI